MTAPTDLNAYRPDGPSITVRKALWSIPEAMILLNLSRTVVYQLIRAGRLRTVKEGRSRRVPDSAITDYVALLEREAA